MSKLFPHVEDTSKAGWLIGMVRDMPPMWIKQMFYGENTDRHWPEQHRVIARLWIGGDHSEAGHIARGYVGAEEYFALVRPRVERLKSWIYAVEGPNEQDVTNARARLNLSAFSCRLAELYHDLGVKLIAGNFSTGNPDLADTAALEELAPLVDTCDFLGLHQYGVPSLQSEAEWRALRHRRLIAAYRRMGVSVPPILLTEFGLDGGGTRFGAVGWKRIVPNGDFALYLDQLKWADQELAKDSQVVAAFLFSSGGTRDRESFELGKHEWAALLATMREPESPVPHPDPAPTPEPAHSAEEYLGKLEERVAALEAWRETLTADS